LFCLPEDVGSPFVSLFFLGSFFFEKDNKITGQITDTDYGKATITDSEKPDAEDKI
jgi:hypothetical protein